MTIELDSYILPARWASYFINNDASGLTDADRADIARWQDGYWPGECMSVSDDSWFAWRNDATDMGDDVATFSFNPYTPTSPLTH